MNRHEERMIPLLKSDQVPEIQRPEWLTESALNKPLPILDLLSESVYYPASGLDTDPMMHLGHYFWSFVYADYGYTSEEIRMALGAGKFGEFKLLAQRAVTEDELPLTRWNAETRGLLAEGQPQGNNTGPFFRSGRCPFAEWALLERNYGPDKPRELMSLLYVGADGVALLEKLYADNRITPACVCVIQAPPAMGGFNWTNFEDENEILAQTLNRNSSGSPRFFLHGCGGKAEWYKKPCWPAYGRCLAWPLERTEETGPGKPLRRRREGALSLWERTA